MKYLELKYNTKTRNLKFTIISHPRFKIHLSAYPSITLKKKLANPNQQH